MTSWIFYNFANLPALPETIVKKDPLREKENLYFVKTFNFMGCFESGLNQSDTNSAIQDAYLLIRNIL